VITKEKLKRDVIISSHHISVERPYALGPYTQVNSSEGYMDTIRPHLERMGAELRIGVNYNMDPTTHRGAREAQKEHMVSSLHRYMYGGVADQLYRIIDDVRMLSPSGDNPALTKLQSLLKDLTEG
jgi:hypothetical protein